MPHFTSAEPCSTIKKSRTIINMLVDIFPILESPLPMFFLMCYREGPAPQPCGKAWGKMSCIRLNFISYYYNHFNFFYQAFTCLEGLANRKVNRT